MKGLPRGLEQELQFQFVRASGPGGQNVNKVATAAQLRFDLAGTQALSAAVKARLRLLAGHRVGADGTLLINARNCRTQEGNRREALARLADLIARKVEAAQGSIDDPECEFQRRTAAHPASHRPHAPRRSCHPVRVALRPCPRE